MSGAGKRGILWLTIFLMLLGLVSCGESTTDTNGGQNNGVLVNGSLKIGVAGGSISSDFALNPSPFTAENETEEALARLIAQPLMRYDEGEWKTVLGTVTLSEENGKTVGTVKIRNDATYYNGKTAVNINQYYSLLHKLASMSMSGCLADYYKSPIEGLVGYRYGYRDLTLEQVPDFEEEAKELADSLTEEGYKQVLIESKMFGFFSGNPMSLCFDGRTFKEAIVAGTAEEAKREDSWFTGSTSTEILEEAALVYSALPREEWQWQLLQENLKESCEKSFADEMKKKAAAEGKRTETISGVKIDGQNCKVQFTEKLSEEEAIRILNLPIMAVNGSMGAGEYLPVKNGFSEQEGEAVIELTGRQGQSLVVFTLSSPKDELYTSVRIGAVDAVLLDFDPTAQEQAAEEEKGHLRFARIGESTVIFNPDSVTLEELKNLELFY